MVHSARLRPFHSPILSPGEKRAGLQSTETEKLRKVDSGAELLTPPYCRLASVACDCPGRHFCSRHRSAVVPSPTGIARYAHRRSRGAAAHPSDSGLRHFHGAQSAQHTVTSHMPISLHPPTPHTLPLLSQSTQTVCGMLIAGGTPRAAGSAHFPL